MRGQNKVFCYLHRRKTINYIPNMDRKVYLTKVIHECPYYDDPCIDCPVIDYRNASLSELIRDLEGLTNDDILSLNKKHLACYRKRAC